MKLMKTKFFFLLAAMLLSSASAFAQSGNNEPLKGDVNGDGTVDVADIAAIIEIMKNGGGTGEQTTYYWYAGQTQPTSINGTPEVDDTNFTNNKWHTLGTTLPSTISKMVTGGSRGNEWYVATPKGQYIPTASDLLTPDTAQIIINTITIGTIQYDVWNTGVDGNRINTLMKKQ